MQLRLYRSSKHTPFAVPVNAGFDWDVIMHLLEMLKSQGQVTYEVVDSSTLSDQELYEAYSLAAALVVVRKGRMGYKIRQVFGTRRSSGIYFGKQVPALLVYEPEGDSLIDVYPHQVGQAIVTIKEFLESL